MSSGHAYGYSHDDDDQKMIINSGAHSLPVVAPPEPKSKLVLHLMLDGFVPGRIL